MNKNRAPGDPTEADIDLEIMMSPQHAKALAHILSEAIRVYEDAYNIKLTWEADQAAIDKYNLRKG